MAQGVGGSRKVDLGSGLIRREGYFRVDMDPQASPDAVLDVEKDRLPFDDESVDEVLASHLIEHIRDLQHLFEEVYRILRPEGRFHVVCPHYMHSTAHDDPTHIRAITPFFFAYLSRALEGSDRRPFVFGNFDFDVEDLQLRIDPEARERFGKDELDFAARHYWNVICEIAAVLKPVKPPRELPTPEPWSPGETR